MPTTAELLKQGFQLHRDGKYDEAREIYGRVIELDATHAPAHHLLGLLSYQAGQFSCAVEHLQQAIHSDGSQAVYFANLADAYRRLAEFDRAIESYDQALRLQPSAEVHVRRAALLEEIGQLDAALAGYQTALHHEPRCFEALVRLGCIHKQQGRLADALECYQRAARVRPGVAAVHYEIGDVSRQQDRWEDAVAGYRQAVMLAPDDAPARVSLGTALRLLGHADAALSHLQRAVALQPDMALAHNNLGTALHDLARLDEALVCFERAVELEPARARFLFNLATVQQDRGRVEEAIALYTRALDVEPGYPQALWRRGTALLSLGRFREGWLEYECRLACRESHNTLKLQQPTWDGSPVESGRLLIHGEQGFGDTLQFVRYLPLVRQRAANVTLAAYEALVPLLEQSGYGPLVSLEGPLGEFDLHLPLLSLPRVFGTTLDSVPAEVPYLAAEPARQERWRAELLPHEGFRVGIAWQGRRRFRLDPLRSIPLAQFAPLARVDDVRLVSLQIGTGAEQLRGAACEFDVFDLAARLEEAGADFSDTAAAMQCLDLVITSDTVLAHLAGALGVNVWVALGHAPDWRWMVGRNDSPWYPTMRLFRQNRPGDWPEVFDRMAGELRKRVAPTSSSS